MSRAHTSPHRLGRRLALTAAFAALVGLVGWAVSPASAALGRAAPSAAPSTAPLATLVAGTPTDVSGLGSATAVSADGTLAVAGAPYGRNNTGAVYVFERVGTAWVQTAMLTASDQAPGDYFGWSVAVTADGSEIVVGAVGDHAFTGAVYVFELAGKAWTQQAELTASDGIAAAEVGYSVAASADGSVVVAGAAGYGYDEGRAYVYQQAGGSWQQEAELVNAHPAYLTNLGASVALSSDGSTALVGAPGYRGGRGELFVFATGSSGWHERQRVVAPGTRTGSEFGAAVTLSSNGGTAVVGAFGIHHGAGAAYVYGRVGGRLQLTTTLQPNARWRRGAFGTSLAIDAAGSEVVVGAPGFDQQTGAAVEYRSLDSGWAPAAVLRTSGGAAYDELGNASAISADGTEIVLGAPNHALAGSDYIFGS